MNIQPKPNLQAFRLTFSYTDYPSDHPATKSDECAFCRNALFHLIDASANSSFPDSIEGNSFSAKIAPNDFSATKFLKIERIEL